MHLRKELKTTFLEVFLNESPALHELELRFDYLISHLFETEQINFFIWMLDYYNPEHYRHLKSKLVTFADKYPEYIQRLDINDRRKQIHIFLNPHNIELLHHHPLSIRFSDINYRKGDESDASSYLASLV